VARPGPPVMQAKQNYPGPFECHMTRIGDQAGPAITNIEPGKSAPPRRDRPA
jgi:hypothetical protein